MSKFTIVIVAVEKELEDYEEAVEACKKTVGPMKVVTAFRAVDAVSRLSVSARMHRRGRAGREGVGRWHAGSVVRHSEGVACLCCSRLRTTVWRCNRRAAMDHQRFGRHTLHSDPF